MKSAKKTIALLLSVLMLAALFPTPAAILAEEAPDKQGTCGEGLTWRIEETDGVWIYNDTGAVVTDENDYDTENTHYETRYALFIKGSGDMDDYRAPEGDEDVVWRPWFTYAREISQVIVEEGVTGIGNNAFRWCNNLRSVSLPSTLKRIGEFAFESCMIGVGDEGSFTPTDGMRRISLPDNVAFIGSRAFANNPFLDTVDFGGDFESVCLAGEDFAADWIPVDRVREVFDGSVWFDNWFANNYMRGSCGAHLNWWLEENGDGFWMYNGTDDIVTDEADFGKDDTHFETRYTLFIDGSGDMDNFIYEDETQIPQPWEASRWQISAVDLAEGVTSIGDNAFRWCNNLRSVTLPETLTRIGAWAFENCQDGDFDENGRWYPTDSLRSVSIPENVTYIGSRAFANNAFLDTVDFGGDLPAACVAGEDYAENWVPANRLREVFSDTAWFESWFHENCMQGTCGEHLTWRLEETDGVWYYNDSGDEVTDENDFDTDNTHYETRYILYIEGEGAMDDYFYDDDFRNPQPWDASGNEISEVIVAEGVTSIGNSAFRWFNSLRDVTLPSTLERIGEWAFESCQTGRDDENGRWYPTDSLRSISIPETVAYLGIAAFANNPFLDTVDFGGDLPAVCLAGEEWVENWGPAARAREVFDHTAWYDAWFAENCMKGDCGAGMTWRLVETDGVWVYNGTNTVVTDENDFDTDDTHYETRYILYIEGEGAMDDYFYNDDARNPQPWDVSSGEIAAVVVDEGVTSIGSSAFRWCNNLRDVTLPSTLERIGEWAFESCQTGEDDENGRWHPTDGLRSVTIPDNVTYIGSMAFGNNEFLDTVDFGGVLPAVCVAGEGWAENWVDASRLREVFENTAWFNNWFAENCMQGVCGEGLTWRLVETDGVWIYNGTNTVVTDENDFDTDNTHYETRYILYIEGSGDMDNYSHEDENFNPPPWDASRNEISEVIVAEGVTSIGSSAFRWCDNLRAVSLPESLLSIGEWAFESCRSGNEDENGNWYPTDGLRSITIPGGVEYIGSMAFAHNDYLDTVEFSGDLPAVCVAGEEWAEDWAPARRVHEVFENTAWYENWFAENYMQGSCGENLTWRLEETDGVWYYNDSGDVVTDENDFDTDNTHYERRYILYIEGTGEMDNYSQEGENRNPPPWDASRNEISEVIVSEGVTGVGNSAFRWFSQLRVVSLPESLLRIGEWAFESCRNGNEDENGNWYPTDGLRSITIPGGVEYIGSMAFAHNDYLDTVEFSGDLPAVCVSGEGWAENQTDGFRLREVFEQTAWYEAWFIENCMSGVCGENLTWRLEETDGVWVDNETGLPVTTRAGSGNDGTHYERRLILYIEGTGDMDGYDFNEEAFNLPPWDMSAWEISAVVIGEGVTSIGSHAFHWYPNLRSVSLPESLTSIGESAFEEDQLSWNDGNGRQIADSLRSIRIPAGVTYIAGRAFANNAFLEDVAFDGDLRDICLAGEAEVAEWHPMSRVREVFQNTAFFDTLDAETLQKGRCGKSATWKLEKTGDGVWFWVDDGRPVEDENDYGAEGTAYAEFYRLVISGEGAIADYDKENPPAWDYYGINVQEIVIEEGITSVGSGTFGVCPEVRTLRLPTTLTRIDANAFPDNEHLADIYYAYPGDEDMYQKIEIANGNPALENAEVHLHTHTEGAPVKENERPVTCTVDGGYDEVVYCTECHKELSRATLTVFHPGHDWGDPIYTWSKDLTSCEAKVICKNDPTHTESEEVKSVLSEEESKAPTCTEAGKNVYLARFNNKRYYSQRKEVILPALGHDFGAWAVTTPATCTEKGVETRACSRCTATEAREIPALKHSFGAWTKLDDTQHQRVCANNAAHVEKANHTWDEGKVTAVATCKDAGVKTYTCAVCGGTKTEAIPKLTEHTWDAGKVTAAATCKDAGVKTFTCTVCGETKTEAVPKLTEHTWDAGKVTTAATCKAAGVKTYTCTVCGEKKTEAIPKLTEHSWNDGEVTKEPTATEEGVKTFTCTVCGEKKTEPIEKLPNTTPDFMPGDVNGDGKVTAADARFALRRAVGLETYEPGSAKFLACDVDGNGKVTAADARKILRAAVGLEKLK